MLAWINWLKSSNSGSAAEKLSLKTRLGYSLKRPVWILGSLRIDYIFQPFLFAVLYSDFHTFYQVSVEKSCMQFSIQRPTLPSAETHPEEKLYRRLDVTVWLRHLNQNGQVEEEYKLRKVSHMQVFFIHWHYVQKKKKHSMSVSPAVIHKVTSSCITRSHTNWKSFWKPPPSSITFSFNHHPRPWGKVNRGQVVLMSHFSFLNLSQLKVSHHTEMTQWQLDCDQHISPVNRRALFALDI